MEIKKGKIWYYLELFEHCQLYTEEELIETEKMFKRTKNVLDDTIEVMKNYKSIGIGDVEAMEIVHFDVFKKNFEKAYLVHITEILSTNSEVELDVLITMMKWHKKSFESVVLELSAILENPFCVDSKVLIKHKINVLKALNSFIEQKLYILEYAPPLKITPSVSKIEFPFHIKLIGNGALLGLYIKCLTEGEFKHLTPLKEKDFEDIIKPYGLKDAKNVFQYFRSSRDKDPLNSKNKDLIKDILQDLGNYPKSLKYLDKLKIT